MLMVVEIVDEIASLDHVQFCLPLCWGSLLTFLFIVAEFFDGIAICCFLFLVFYAFKGWFSILLCIQDCLVKPHFVTLTIGLVFHPLLLVWDHI
jgi:hypothetical protein